MQKEEEGRFFFRYCRQKERERGKKLSLSFGGGEGRQWESGHRQKSGILRNQETGQKKTVTV